MKLPALPRSCPSVEGRGGGGCKMIGELLRRCINLFHKRVLDNHLISNKRENKNNHKTANMQYITCKKFRTILISDQNSVRK